MYFQHHYSSLQCHVIFKNHHDWSNDAENDNISVFYCVCMNAAVLSRRDSSWIMNVWWFVRSWSVCLCAGWWWASSSRRSVCPAEVRSTRWPMMMSSTEWLRSSWTIRRTRVWVTVSLVCVCVCVCVCERESVCVWERECVSTWHRVHSHTTPCRKCRESSDMILRTALLVMCLITSIKVAFKQAIQSGNIYKHRRQVTLGTSASLLC